MTITCINISEIKPSGLRPPRDKEHCTTRCNRLKLIERTLTSLICDYIYFNLGYKNDHIVLNLGHKKDHTVLFTLILDQEKVYIIFFVEASTCCCSNFCYKLAAMLYRDLHH